MVPAKIPPILEPFDLITAKAVSWINGFFLQIPNLIAAAVFLFLAYLVGKGLVSLIRTLAGRRDRGDLGALLGSIAFGALMVMAVMIAAAIVFPSVKPASILGALGIGSVAIGFAFKDILQNLFAGLLLLIHRPYRRGDQIVVNDFEGTVEHIESRATLIKTYDGRRVVIPNFDLYTAPVIVNTAFPTRRDEIVIGVGYGDGPRRAAEIFLATVRKVEGVLEDPAPDVLPWELADNDVRLKVRWWTNSLRRDIVAVRSRVVQAVFEACVEAGIDIPFPTQVVLFHDQTEETDGDRTRQREGWPAGDNPPPAARNGAVSASAAATPRLAAPRRQSQARS